jgi:uncharacterized membrane protein
MEKQARYGAEWLRPLVEALGVIAIAAGFAVALAGDLCRKGWNFLPIRSSFEGYPTLALELQLANILSTAIAPGRERIG